MSIEGVFKVNHDNGGWRLYVAYDEGRKYVRLLNPATGEKLRVEREAMRFARPVDMTATDWRRIARLMKRQRRTYKGLGLAVTADWKRLAEEAAATGAA